MGVTIRQNQTVYIENNGGSKNLFPLIPKQKVGAYYNG